MAAARYVIFRPEPLPDDPSPRGWVVVRENYNEKLENHQIHEDVTEPNELEENDWPEFKEFTYDTKMSEVMVWVQENHPGYDVFVPQGKYFQGMPPEVPEEVSI